MLHARQTNTWSQRDESRMETSQRIEASGLTFHKDFETVQLLAPETANDMQGSWSHSARCSHASGNPMQQNLLQLVAEEIMLQLYIVSTTRNSTTATRMYI